MKYTNTLEAVSPVDTKIKPKDSHLKLLTHIANKYRCNKGTNFSESCGFTEIYDDVFLSSRENIKDMLEVGVDDGRSLKMWEEYFPNANILALDILDKKKYETARAKTLLLDQSSREELQKFAADNFEKFDFIIDDGSHHMLDQQITFYYLFTKCLKPGGIYVLEDLHTSTVKNGRMLYGKRLEIYEDRSNTTLYVLENRPFASPYLEKSECKEIEDMIQSSEVFRINNPKSKWGPDSITSVIVKEK
jgi:hypothetical protein